MSKLHRFRNRILRNPFFTQKPIQSLANLHWLHQSMFWHVCVRIIFRHSCKINFIWSIRPTIKIWKIPIRKSLRNFNRSVRPKVKINQSIAFFNFPDRLLCIIHNNKRRQILVLHRRVNSSKHRHRFLRRLKIIVCFSIYHRTKTSCHNFPIIFITISHIYHPTATIRNFNICIRKLVCKTFELPNIFRLRHRSHITPIKHRVHSHFPHPLSISPLNHLHKMCNMAMHSSIRKNPRKM